MSRRLTRRNLLTAGGGAAGVAALGGLTGLAGTAMAASDRDPRERPNVVLIMADRTSGKETYGAGRFLYAEPPAKGSSTVIVDFNAAYNPPCVFTPYATCPLAPPENRLDLAVTAGEKKYRGATH